MRCAFLFLTLLGFMDLEVAKPDERMKEVLCIRAVQAEDDAFERERRLREDEKRRQFRIDATIVSLFFIIAMIVILYPKEPRQPLTP